MPYLSGNPLNINLGKMCRVLLSDTGILWSGKTQAKRGTCKKGTISIFLWCKKSTRLVPN